MTSPRKNALRRLGTRFCAVCSDKLALRWAVTVETDGVLTPMTSTTMTMRLCASDACHAAVIGLPVTYGKGGTIQISKNNECIGTVTAVGEVGIA